MEYTQEIALDVATGAPKQRVFAKEGDNVTRNLKIRLLKDGEKLVPEEGATAMFRVEKPDGHAVINPAKIEEDGTVTVTLTRQALARRGLAQADIYLEKDDEILSTACFYLDIKEMPDVAKQTASSDEFGVFVDKLNRLEDAIPEAEAAGKNANDAAKKANEAATKANAAADKAEQSASAADTATQDTKTATQAAEDATGAANDAAGKATTAAGEATDAAGKASAAAQSAEGAATKANEAAGKAETAAEKAETAASAAEEAAGGAATSAGAADTAAGKANDAATKADEAAGRVDAAIQSATKAAEAATAAAGEATAAAGEATTAAQSATDAAGKAETAASAANAAAEAAGKVNISASDTDAGINVTVTDREGTETTVSVRDGVDGKSAYQYAQDGGYTESEEVFTELLGKGITNRTVQEETSEAGTSRIANAEEGGKVEFESAEHVTGVYVSDGAVKASSSTPEGEGARVIIDGTKASYVKGSEAEPTEDDELLVRKDLAEYATVKQLDELGKRWDLSTDWSATTGDWTEVQRVVRAGEGPKTFPVGWEFSMINTLNNRLFTWRVVAHDHHKKADEPEAHTMTLAMKNVYSLANGGQQAVVFSQPDAWYYAEEGLEPGTYHFTGGTDLTEGTGGDIKDSSGKTYQFTLTKAVPAGGQITIDPSEDKVFTGHNVVTFASSSSSEEIERAEITEGSEGTDLGTTGVGNFNHFTRFRVGSNNYAQSALRQWLNTDETGNEWYKPQTRFNRFATKGYPTFKETLPADFLAAVATAEIPCQTNNIFETASLDGTEFTVRQTYTLKEQFFPLSRPEVYGTQEASDRGDGDFLEFYNGLTDAERIQVDVGGAARWVWLRSPSVGNAYYARHVGNSGGLNDNSANSAYAVAPACIIA